MPEPRDPTKPYAGDYRIELDRRLVPIALLVPLALCVDILSKAAGLGNVLRLAVAATVGAMFVGFSVATSTNRGAVANASDRERRAGSAKLRKAMRLLTDDELTVRALELYWAEIDLDDSLAPQLKLLILESLHDAVGQLRDPKPRRKGATASAPSASTFDSANYKGGAHGALGRSRTKHTSPMVTSTLASILREAGTSRVPRPPIVGQMPPATSSAR